MWKQALMKSFFFFNFFFKFPLKYMGYGHLSVEGGMVLGTLKTYYIIARDL